MSSKKPDEARSGNKSKARPDEGKQRPENFKVKLQVTCKPLMAKRKAGGFKTKKKRQKLKGSCGKKKAGGKRRHQEVQSEAKLIKGLDTICSQLSVLDVSKQPATSSEASRTSCQSRAEAFKKSPLKPEAIDVKLVKSLKHLTCEETADDKEVPPGTEESSDFYQRQWSEFKKYSRKQGKKLRISKRKHGKTYRLLQDLENSES